MPRLRPSWMLLGPAFVAAIAYVDPGNVAANISAGAQFGFLLVWVIVVANAMAGLVQYLSAKLGLVTGRSLPEAVADHTRTPTRIAYWLQAEMVAMATDLAEVVGGAIALHLLFDLPLLVGGVITGVVSLLLLAVQNRRGQRTFERVITGLLLIIAIGFLASLFVEPRPAAKSPRACCRGSTAPRACCWPPPCSARPSCRTRCTCIPAWPATGTATPSRRAAAPVAPGHPLGRRARDAGRRRRQPGDAAGGRDQAAGRRRHRLHRRRARRGSGHARPDGRAAVRGRPAGLGAGLDLGGRLRGRDDHAGAAAPVHTRCCCAGWSR